MGSTTRSSTAATGTAAVGCRNEVALRGRLSAPPEARTLPSGDEVVVFRLVVDRPSTVRGRTSARGQSSGRRAPTVDTFDCAVWRAAHRRAAGGWAAGDVIELTGALRRRFWRTAGGAASRHEVEVTTVRVVQRVGRRTSS